MPRRWPRSLLVLLAATLLAAATACSDGGGTSDDARPPGTTADGPTEGTAATADDAGARLTEFEECGRVLWCATLTAPVDWDDPEGPEIEVAVAAKPATDPEERIGLLLLNPGGPGASGIEFLRQTGLIPGMDELNERFDLVSWDPRGVGDSERLVCDTDAIDEFRHLDPHPDDAREQAALDETAQRIADSCTDEAPELVSNLGTDQTIGDIDAIRAAFGDEQISWLGFSYGTLLGQRYAEAHPDRVRAMVLDGVVDPADGLAGLLRAQAVGLDDQIDGELADAYDRVMALAEQAPIPADGGKAAGPAEVTLAAVMASYDAYFAGQLPGALADAEDGDATDLVALAESYWAFGDYPAYIGTLCADSPHPVGTDEALELAEDLADAAPRSGAAVANEVLPCALWAPTDPPPAEPIVAAGTPTILVVGNTGDVATPVEQAERVAEALADAVLVVHEGTGHTSFSSSTCVNRLVVAYLVDLDVPEEGTRCTD